MSNITYDANGNIQTLKRTRNYTSSGNLMDNLQYHYTPGTNQLDYVDDTSGNTEDDGDIKDQAIGNYSYNAIGQLTHSVDGDVNYTYFTNGLPHKAYTINGLGVEQGVEFTYNDRGHRVHKRQYTNSFGQSDNNTYYVRDASGQPLAIYMLTPDPSNLGSIVTNIEYPMYGLSRVGIASGDGVYRYQLTDHLGNIRGVIQRDYTPNVVYSEDFEQGGVSTPPWHSFLNTSVSVVNGALKADVSNIPDKNNIKLSFTGQAHKPYEIEFDVNLTNTQYVFHYGIDGVDEGTAMNSQTVSFTYTPLQNGTFDIHFGLDTDPTMPVISNFYTIDNVVITDISVDNTPIMLSYRDYYPFGMPLPNRNVQGDYRYGYQGEFAETDPETEMPAFELRLWDARLGRWLTMDPYGQHSSPYLGMSNNPISYIDPDGGYDTKWKRFWAWVGGGFKGKFHNVADPATPHTKYGIIHSSGTDDGGVLFTIDFGDWKQATADDIIQGWHDAEMDRKYMTTYDNRLSAIASVFQLALPNAPNIPKVPVFRSSNQMSKVDEIALGVSENLDDFASALNAKTWKTWAADDFATQFLNKINDASTKIHFNLTGADGKAINVWKAIQEGSRGLGNSRATSWELYQIYSNPSVLQRTTFYLNGKPTLSPF